MELREQAERCLGTEIFQSEWDDALRKAREKVRRTINAYGDAGGARLKVLYLAEIIAETVKAERLSGFARNMIAFENYERKYGVKKQPLS